MLKIKQVLFLMFGVTSFIIFYMGFLNYITIEDKFVGTTMLVFSVMVSLGTLFGTFYISKSITNPIDVLITKMKQFSSNNKNEYNVNINHNIHELQYLHENFQKMTEIVSSTIEKEKELNKRLQDMDKRKVEFMSMVSHELKTPIMPILGYIKLLKKQELLGTLNDKQLDAINEIQIATTRLEKLIQDVLTAQKMDLEKINIIEQAVESKEIIESIYNAFSPLCSMKDVMFVKNASENHIIYSDPDRIYQIFSNLISNALEFVPENNPLIEIGCFRKEGFMVFFVKDNGQGISKDEQKHIFKKFYQVDASLKRKKEGSGLGLSICQGIAQMLKGHIWVESTPGKGTGFYFKIPIEKIQVKNF